MKKTFCLFWLVLLSCTTAFALNPSRSYKQKPDAFNMVYTEHKVKTVDGHTLNAWYFPNKANTKSLILVSHNGEGNMADYLNVVDGLLKLGHNVMIYDYRGFGESSEFDMDNNMYIYPHFQDDVTAMIGYCKDNLSPTFSMFGWGIGGGLSLGIGYHSTAVTKIVADSPFLSMEDLEKRFSSWDTPMEVPFAGFDKKHEPIFTLDMEPSTSLKKILLIVGNSDLILKVADMNNLKTKKTKLITVVEINNPGKVNNFDADQETYFKALEKGLK